MYPGYSPNTLTVGGTTLALNGTTTSFLASKLGVMAAAASAYTRRNPASKMASSRKALPSAPRPMWRSTPIQFTGVPVYDSFNNGNSRRLGKGGGTSFATPSWGALVAIADQGRNLAGKPVLDDPTLMSMLYAMPASNFNDITIGSSTGATPQAATPGYDLVTGRGTPKGAVDRRRPGRCGGGFWHGVQ